MIHKEVDRKFGRPGKDYRTPFALTAQERDQKTELELDLHKVGVKFEGACTRSLSSGAKAKQLYYKT
jgi:hypothetical protein